MAIDYSKLIDVELDSYPRNPDYWCDVFIEKAYYDLGNGKYRELTEEEYDELNDDSDYIYGLLINSF